MIYPDLDGKAATNIISVSIMRLRQRLGTVDLVESTGAGYSLRYRVNVDVLMLEDALARNRMLETLDPALEEVIESKNARLPQWTLMIEWLAPFVRRYEAAIYQIRLYRASAPTASQSRRAHYDRLLSSEEAE